MNEAFSSINITDEVPTALVDRLFREFRDTLGLFFVKYIIVETTERKVIYAIQDAEINHSNFWMFIPEKFNVSNVIAAGDFKLFDSNQIILDKADPRTTQSQSLAYDYGVDRYNYQLNAGHKLLMPMLTSSETNWYINGSLGEEA